MGFSSFPVRAFHLDLRIQVMTPSALRALAQELVQFGFNTLVVEWEAAFPFRKHPVLANRFVYSRKEILGFLKFCRVLGLKTMPIQQCFGHVEYILMHDRYARLREDERDICQVCPQKAEEALPLFRDLFEELAEVHDSEYFYVGCDETYVLGKCPACAEKVRAQGKSRLYVDYLNRILPLASAMGKRPVIPADMLLAHPEAACDLPRDTVLVDWNYGWAPDRFGSPEPLLKTGLEFWGSLSLRSGPDNYYLHTWEKHLNNYRDFLPYCREKGYKGAVLTSWSTSGIYGFEWDAFYEVVATHPIRRVYPLKGFRLLTAAFSLALSDAGTFEPERFVRAYGMDRFGLSEDEAGRFYQALLSDSSSVYKPKADLYRPAEEVLKSVLSGRKVLESLKPRLNAGEFDHFRLMAALRENYLRFKIVEAKTEEEGFGEKGRLAAIRGLKAGLSAEKGLSRRFGALLKGYLHPGEIEAENNWRSRKWTALLERLARKR